MQAGNIVEGAVQQQEKWMKERRRKKTRGYAREQGWKKQEQKKD